MRRFHLIEKLIFVLAVFACPDPGLTASQDIGRMSEALPSAIPDHVRKLRLRGDLAAAKSLAEETVQNPDTNPQLAFELHLELARIHDRFGLHFRNRPVVAALAEIDLATSLAADLGETFQARAKLARAYYHYRAEMSERQFPVSIRLTEQSMAMFSSANLLHDQAEAVHLRGLIHLQMRELDLARKRFDESLELDEMGGARVFFRGEYERHVAFVYIFQDRPDLAVPHLERSLEARKAAGAIDASLFAANTLASQRLALGELETIPAVLAYAETVLEALNSPYGEYQFLIISGRYLETVEDHCLAARLFERAGTVAASIDWTAGVGQANEFLDRTSQSTRDCT